jgi:hypothetical protein
MSNTSITELEIVIPKDKLNDLNYIYLKLMEVSLDTLLEISKHSEQNFIDLVQSFIPELKNIENDTFLSRWNLSKAILNGNLTKIISNENIVNEIVPKTAVQSKQIDNIVTTNPGVDTLQSMEEHSTNLDMTESPPLSTGTSDILVEKKAVKKPKKLKLSKKSSNIKLKLSKKSSKIKLKPKLSKPKLSKPISAAADLVKPKKKLVKRKLN